MSMDVLLMDYLRKRYRHPKRSEIDESDWPAPETPKEVDDAPLVQAVFQLPLKLREAILLFYVEECSYEEIARRLDITRAAVNQRLTRAREQLRQHLTREGGYRR